MDLAWPTNRSVKIGQKIQTDKNDPQPPQFVWETRIGARSRSIYDTTEEREDTFVLLATTTTRHHQR